VIRRVFVAKSGNFRINQSLLTISANQPSIVLVRAARRRYRLYHQQPLQNAPLMPHGAAIKFRPRSIKDTLELTTVRTRPDRGQPALAKITKGSQSQHPSSAGRPAKVLRCLTHRSTRLGIRNPGKEEPIRPLPPDQPQPVCPPQYGEGLSC